MPSSRITKKPLKVLNASAGSGKTHRLVQNYIQLVISDSSASIVFKQIMAMTFTNKAAFEMKERIIYNLDKLASTPDYTKDNYGLGLELMREEGISEDELKIKCKKALEGILHQYEDFNIMTIDKFNLRLIRSFGKELNLPDDFEVVLDEKEIIAQIVDDLINKLGSEENEKLNEIILAYARRNIDNDTQWNFRRDLIEFGKILQNEKNQDLIIKLLDTDFSMDHYGQTIAKKEKLKKAYLNLANELSDILTNDPHDQEELPYKSNTLKAIGKITDSTDLPSKNPLEGYILKALETELKPDQRIADQLRNQLYTISKFYDEHIESYTSLSLFLKNFFNMALLQYMGEELIRIRKDEKLIRISEFNTLISALIKNEKAPFIYEKLGTRIHHFLLDEFQDTSRLQWLNLVPLVKESLSNNHKNLIVGDPKQSIYRFKNGVADQFVELPAIYNPENDPKIHVDSDYFKSMGEVKILDNNWRSSPVIVNFNNNFFTTIRELLPENIKRYYESVIQHPKSNNGGNVFIISKEEKKSSDDLIPMIESWIEKCVEDGYKHGDICILGDRNKECNSWAITLNAMGYDVVSADSLLINSSLKVQLTIAYLYWRLKPSGKNELKRFAELFCRVNNKPYEDYAKYLKEYETESGKKYRQFDEIHFINDHFGSYEKFFFKYEQLYDLLQGFYSITGFKELKDPYLHHLADVSFDYGLHKGPDLGGFLEYYETNKDKMAVQIPESDSAITVMTIHKSKGLEFPVVIIPSMNFSNAVNSKFLTEVDDYIIYKQVNQNELIHQLGELHRQEASQIVGDNMNKCYVAMTRPKERLYIGNYYDKRSFGATFHQALKGVESSKEADGEIIVNLSQSGESIKNTPNKEDIRFVPKSIDEQLWFPNIALQDKDELKDNDLLNNKTRFGNEFHLIASRVKNEIELGTVLKKAVRMGEVSVENKSQIKDAILKLYNNSDYNKLFENATSILSEQEFIVDQDSTLRPDKIILKDAETIIVDYKTGAGEPKDHKQVRDYINVLTQMGYPSIKGYLYYVHSDSLEACN